MEAIIGLGADGRRRFQKEVKSRGGEMGLDTVRGLVNKGTNRGGRLEVACALRIGDVDGNVAPIEEAAQIRKHYREQRLVRR